MKMHARWPACFYAILVAFLILSSCVYRELPTGVDCSTSDLSISLVSKKNATSCKSIDGEIVVSAKGGVGAYDFSLGDGVYQTNPVFERLAPGSYSVTVKDINGCKQSVRVDLDADNSTLTAVSSAVPDSQCFSDNGSITVNVSGGTAPYQIKIDNGTFGSASTFNSLANGNHTVIIKDASDCERTMIVAVPRASTGVSYTKDIVPIFNRSCNFSGCHGAGTSGRDWTKYSDVKVKASDIKTRTSNRSMPIGSGPLLSTMTLTSLAQKYTVEKSMVVFFSDASIEDITAKNSKSSSIFNVETGEIAFSIPIQEFEFAKSLMKEHFNEKYMDTEKFPKSTFQGKITGYDATKTGSQPATATGKLTIHGVTKDVEIPGTLEISPEKVLMHSKFIVKLDDYGVKRPQLLWKNIAEQVEVTVDFTYKPHDNK